MSAVICPLPHRCDTVSNYGISMKALLSSVHPPRRQALLACTTYDLPGP